MSNENFNMGEVDAPDNQEREFLTPGYHKLTVKSFEYTKEEEGKTPLIVMLAEKADKNGGDPIQFKEKFYMSGKENDQGKVSSVIRVQELVKGLTGDAIKLEMKRYAYTKNNSDGSSNEYTIPDPAQLCAYLNKVCTGKTAIFKVGGEETEDGKLYTKLVYSGFLYYTDKQKQLCRYKEERDFTDSEHKFAVQKRKSANAPVGTGGVGTGSKMDQI